MYECQTKYVLDAEDKSCKITVFLIEGVTFFFNLAQMFISVHFSCEPYLSSHLAKSPNYHWTLLWFSGRSAKSDGFSKMPIEKPKMGDYPRNLLDFWRSSLVVHNVYILQSISPPAKNALLQLRGNIVLPFSWYRGKEQTFLDPSPKLFTGHIIPDKRSHKGLYLLKVLSQN